jgi:hypothetical protein
MSDRARIIHGPMRTTIRVNDLTPGLHGTHFLPLLVETLASHRDLAPQLAPLLDGRVSSLEVDIQVAERVANMIEPFLVADDIEPPLLFSPNVGDSVVIVRDALLEFQSPARRGPKIWRFTPRGTTGRVIAHDGETYCVQLDGSREIAHVRPPSITCSRFWFAAPR